MRPVISHLCRRLLPPTALPCPYTRVTRCSLLLSVKAQSFPLSFPLHPVSMSRRSGRVAALQQRSELLALQQQFDEEEEGEDDAGFSFVEEEVDSEEVEVIDSPPPPKQSNRLQLPVKKKPAHPADSSKRKGDGATLVAATEKVAVVESKTELKGDKGGEEKGDEEEAEDEEEEEEYVDKKRSKRKKPTSATPKPRAPRKPSTPRVSKASKMAAALIDAEDESEPLKANAEVKESKVEDADAEEDGAQEEEADEDEASTSEKRKRKKPASPAKARAPRKAATPRAKKAKAAPTPVGGADDPIQLSDGDDDGGEGEEAAAAAKRKKAPRAKKVKAVPVIERIRPSSSAQSNTRKLIGAHVSTSGGVQYAPHNAALMGARAFAMDTRSKRRWVSPPYSADIIGQFHSTMQHYGFSGDVVVPHGSYLMNLGSLVDSLYDKSKQCLREELERCEQLGVRLYNFHPGRFNLPPEEMDEWKQAEKERKKAARERERDRKQRLKRGEEVSDDEAEDDGHTVALARRMAELRTQSLQRLIDALNWAHTLPTCSTVCILLETMAGGGTCLGSSFEELRYVIDRVHNKARIGVCVDTCHIFAADPKYDLRDRATYEWTMKQLETVIGWRYIKAVHLNDSKMPSGSKRDRHENIGDGEIGLDAFKLLMNDDRWNGIPIVLETPCKTEEKERLKKEKKRLKEEGGVKMELGSQQEEEGQENEDGDEEQAEEEEGAGKKKKKQPKKGGEGKAKKQTKKRKGAVDEDEDGGDEEEDGEEGKSAGKKKEKEDWLASYSGEIDLVYSLELPTSSSSVKAEVRVKDEEGGVKAELSSST